MATSTYEVIPLQGVGPLKLGAPRSEIHTILGEPESQKGSADLFHGSSIQVHYDETGGVEFIELASDIHVTWNRIDIFSTPADLLVKEISRFTPLQDGEDEEGYTFTYAESEVSLWRPTMPDEEDPENGKYFTSICIGCRGYFSVAI